MYASLWLKHRVAEEEFFPYFVTMCYIHVGTGYLRNKMRKDNL